ncbi:MAG: hypothetical protein IJ638_00155 [Alphaproteobacteria bacterium]|nr:hypothetical protein [Alphaproteobacteria bacterium]
MNNVSKIKDKNSSSSKKNLDVSNVYIVNMQNGQTVKTNELKAFSDFERVSKECADFSLYVPVDYWEGR